ncbi:MAG: MBL fold metallo-hydrolase [Deltaproteobacteria bacterium]|nr:MBL fold metallo-hydrolase [Deltaproteobacteria bacterium]
MLIRCWGSRGSVPVSGREYLKYGGDTTCLEIRSDNDDLIIVDAGTGIRRLGIELMNQKRFSFDMVFTHAHWDHLMGFPFFAPVYDERSEILIQGCPFAREFIEKMLGKVMSQPNFPIEYSDLKASFKYIPECPLSFQAGSIEIMTIPLSHPNRGNGYKFTEKGKTFVFLTDNELKYQHKGGLGYDDYLGFCKGADLLFHDAEYTPEEYASVRQWGHSSYTDALELAIKAGVKGLGLFHLNQKRTDPEVDSIVEHCNSIISEKHADLECFAVGMDMVFEL